MKNKYYFFIALLLWITTGMLSCTKETLVNTSREDSPLALQKYLVENFVVQNGVLVVEHYKEVNTLVSTLRDMEKDQSTRDAAYENIGITSAIQDSEVNYTDHPVCQEFEQEKNYVSQRSQEEAWLFAELAAGNEEINSIIDRPYLKTLLNEYGAMKIGSRIYKHYDSGLIAMIANSDWSIYEAIKDMGEDQIREDYNLRLISQTEGDFQGYFELETEQRVKAEKAVVDIRLEQKVNADGRIEVRNRSFVSNAMGHEALFEWEYPDGSRSIGQEPTRSYALGETIKVRTNWPGDDWDDTPWWEEEADERGCAIPDFRITPLGNRTFRFDLDHPPTIPGAFVRWDFGDGNTDAGLPAMHTYAASVSDVVQVTCSIRRSNGSVLCEFTKPLEIDPECTLRGNRTGEQVFPNVAGERWRIDCKIWIDNSPWTTGDVGSRSKSLKHNGLAFFGKKAEQIWITLEGVHFRRINSECTINEILPKEESETDSGNVQCNLTDDNDPRIYPNQLWSTHKMKVNGEVLKYDKNGGKLYLN